VGKPEEKCPLERIRGRGKDNITINITEIGWMDMYWVSIAQNVDQVKKFCKGDNKFSGSIKLGESLD
jgi:hypothetical protein